MSQPEPSEQPDPELLITHTHPIMVGYVADYTITREESDAGYMLVSTISHPEVTTTHTDAVYIPDELMVKLAALVNPQPDQPPEPPRSDLCSVCGEYPSHVEHRHVAQPDLQPPSEMVRHFAPWGDTESACGVPLVKAKVLEGEQFTTKRDLTTCPKCRAYIDPPPTPDQDPEPTGATTELQAYAIRMGTFSADMSLINNPVLPSQPPAEFTKRSVDAAIRGLVANGFIILVDPPPASYGPLKGLNSDELPTPHPRASS